MQHYSIIGYKRSPVKQQGCDQTNLKGTRNVFEGPWTVWKNPTQNLIPKPACLHKLLTCRLNMFVLKLISKLNLGCLMFQLEITSF